MFLEQNDWQNPNWKGVAHIIHEAKSEWHRFRDVPNSQRKKAQRRFSSVMDQLEEKLEEEQKKNEAIKEELIRRVRQMLDDNIELPQLVAETKSIQKEWKNVGVTRRSIDQKLWKEFRKNCDMVFERRDRKHTERRQATDEQLNAARALMDRLKEQLAGDRPIERSDLNQFRKDFNSLDLDKEAAHLEREFRQLVKEAESVVEQQVRASKQQMIAEMKRKADICARLESGDIDEAVAEAGWESDVHLEPELADRLEERRHQAIAKDYEAGVLAENQDRAELICVRMEILAGLQSPPEATERRMQYQVDRLNRGLSRGERDTRSRAEQLRELQQEWYCLGPVMEDGEQLRQRFLAAEALLEGNRRD